MIQQILNRTILVLGFFIASTLIAEVSTLKQYVQAPDAAFEVLSVTLTSSDQGLRQYKIEYNSLSWLEPGEVDRQVWNHTIELAIPDQLRSHKGMLLINGGSNSEKFGQNILDKSGFSADMALATGSIVAELKMIPNQPLVFGGDGHQRKEDNLIAYSWAKYLQNGDPQWLAQFPMTKASVRALDVIDQVVKNLLNVDMSGYVVGGASKRGWTTYLVGAVDPRVVGIIPVVIDVLNMVPSMQHHFDSYGFWSDAVRDYENHGIFDKLQSPEVAQMARLIDPFFMLDELTMPKLIIAAANDEFFLPDSSQFYYSRLQGDNRIRYVPNSGHFVNNFDVFDTLAIFYDSLIHSKVMPKLTWQKPSAWRLDVQITGSPVKVLLWEAQTKSGRDFRFRRDMDRYVSREITIQRDGQYQIDVSPASRGGYKAFFVEAQFEDGPIGYMKLTTEVTVAN